MSSRIRQSCSRENPLSGGERTPQPSGVGSAVRNNPPLHPWSYEKNSKPADDREGEAPAEPHGARTGRADGSPGGPPSQFFHSAPPADFPHLRWSVKGFLKRNPPDVHNFFHNLHTSFRDGWAGSCWMAAHKVGLRRSRDFRYFCSS